MNFDNLTETGKFLAQTAFKAGVEIMRLYEGDIEVEIKNDESPVTIADKMAERIILSELEDHFPHIPIISEEAASEGHFPKVTSNFFLVDPLDGTREFIKKNGQFTVNIAHIEDGNSVAGLVYAPALKKAYYGEKNQGAWSIEYENGDDFVSAVVKKISARKTPDQGLIMVCSRSHGDSRQEEFKKEHNITEEKPVGSSLKFCLIAEGEADIYPRFGRTMEWDTAAGQAILESSGGSVTQLDQSTPLLYGKKDRGYDNPGFVAFGAK